MEIFGKPNKSATGGGGAKRTGPEVRHEKDFYRTLIRPEKPLAFPQQAWNEKVDDKINLTAFW